MVSARYLAALLLGSFRLLYLGKPPQQKHPDRIDASELQARRVPLSLLFNPGPPRASPGKTKGRDTLNNSNEITAPNWSGRLDLNQRPLAPQRRLASYQGSSAAPKSSQLFGMRVCRWSSRPSDSHRFPRQRVQIGCNRRRHCVQPAASLKGAPTIFLALRRPRRDWGCVLRRFTRSASAASCPTSECSTRFESFPPTWLLSSMPIAQSPGALPDGCAATLS
jgi:hypothetical protein